MAIAKQNRVVSYTLEIDEAEATTLLDVLMHVGGNEETSRRRHTQAVLEALRNAGVKEGQNDEYGATKDVDQNRRCIYFITQE